MDSSAQTTLGKVLDSFHKISKRARYEVFEKRCFPEGFQAQDRRLELKSTFLVSRKMNTFLEKNWARTKLSLVRASTILSNSREFSANSASLPDLTKKSIC